MTINLKAKKENTLCGGRIDSLINHETSTSTLTFSNIKEVTACPTCPLFAVCPLLRSNSSLILVRAFTNMSIGYLPITKETKDFIEVTTKQNTILKFDRKTGNQLNHLKPKYSNKVDPSEIPHFNPQPKKPDAPTK